MNQDYNASLPLDLEGLTYPLKQQVPGAWDAKWGTGLQYSRGAGVYTTQLPVEAGKKALLHFEACSLFCRVSATPPFIGCIVVPTSPFRATFHPQMK